jgi:sec-independent protein translocase protein TatB
MFDIGFWEIMVITVVALLVVGPERLPGLAREIGRFVGKARRFVSSVRSDIEQELQTEELRKILQDQDREIRELKNMMQETESHLRTDLQDTQNALRKPLLDLEGTLSSAQHGTALDGGSALSGMTTRSSASPPAPPIRRVPVAGSMGPDLLTDHPEPFPEMKGTTPQPLVHPETTTTPPPSTPDSAAVHGVPSAVPSAQPVSEAPKSA